jgi:hypothetical protein
LFITFSFEALTKSKTETKFQKDDGDRNKHEKLDNKRKYFTN